MGLGIRRAGMLAAALVLVLPATGAPARKARAVPQSLFVYDLRQADIDEVVRFQGDPASCAPSGLCGYAGTVHYNFHGRGTGAFTAPTSQDPFGLAFGLAVGSGRTSSDVGFVDGAGNRTARCTDTETFKADGFSGAPGRRRVTIALHQTGTTGADVGVGVGEAQPDYLDTHCAGPRDRDLVAGNAAPSRNYAVSRFRRRRFALVFADTRPFRAGGFQGTVRFRVTFGLVRKFTQPLAEAGPVP
ncbi:MAG: hypothetical protein M3Z33_00800 [Actinomycetota bacterium]|nr:hypothetical protein [Actinomycetota bacterium]